MPVRGMEDCSVFTYWAVSNEDGSVTPLDGFSAIGTTTAYPASTPEFSEEEHTVTIIDDDGNERRVPGHEFTYHSDGTIEMDGHSVPAHIHIPAEVSVSPDGWVPCDGPVTTAVAGTGDQVIAPQIEEEYRGVRIKRLGYVERETDLPWPPIADLWDGDTFTSRETGHDWVWIVDHWEEIRAEYHTLEAAHPQYNDAEVGVDMTDIGDNTAPVLVSDDYLYIPGDMERRVQVHFGDVVGHTAYAAGDPPYNIVNPPIIGSWEEVVGATFNGERINLTERIIESPREPADREGDTTTETTPEAFDDILGVGA